MTEYVLEFPDYFDGYSGEIESKGWFADAVLAVFGRKYRLNFYDPVRLAQDIEGAVGEGKAFFEENLFVIKSVTRSQMENAAAQIVRDKVVASLVPEAAD